MLEEFVKDYLIECQEGLEQFETQLLALERDPTSKQVVSAIFRVVHSIKGASGFLGFPKMAKVTHQGEELLGKLRDGSRETTPAVVSGLLGLIDVIRRIMQSIEATGTEGDEDDSAFIAQLKALQTADPAPSTPPVATPPPEVPPEPAQPEPIAPEPTLVAEKPPAEPAPSHAPEPSAESPTAPASALTDSTIRVDVALLDKLMNLVGELVLTRNQMLRCSLVRDEAMFQASSQRLNLITTELQEGMMKTRMQPIRNLSSKLPRVVRDLAIQCGKQATIIMEGEETELDRTLSEAIKDPIAHIVRNAVDHGLETPEQRVARGKPPEGVIRLRAYHEGGMVNIEVSDDGNGIDPAKLKRKALERGWLTEEQAASWTDRELLGLIFRPGFSTAETLSMVSGRGVGMDVVKSRIESIGGSVDVSSRIGEGTTMKMKIPLTLTIINALIVSAGGDRFAIPQVNLVELIRLKGDAIGAGMINLQGTAVSRYRGKLLPLVDLNRVLNIEAEARPTESDAVNIVVLQADQQRFGLVVDRIDDAQEIVVRPLARQLKSISCLAGATIMGDGKIALILDVFGLAKDLDGTRDRTGNLTARDDQPASQPIDESHAMILLRGTDASPFAIGLREVDRLETFAASTIEWIAGRPLMQYRGNLLPLLDVAAWLTNKQWLGDTSDSTWYQIVIHEHEGKRLGLVFDKVLDIVEDRLDVRGEASRTGVQFTAAIMGRATEVLDVPQIRDRYEESLRAGGVAR